MTIVGSYIFPHGAITLDPQTRNFSGIPAVKPESQEECIKLHEAMLRTAVALVDAKPDLIIFSTPHGLTLMTSFLLLGNMKAQGNAEWDGDWTDYTADIEVDGELSQAIYDSLKESSKIELLKIGAPQDALNLRWGEVIPWWFLQKAASEANWTLPKAVILSHPRRRVKNTQDLIPEILELGRGVSQIIQEKLAKRRVAIVISSDLSHYHSQDPTSPYPYNPNSTVFDGHCVNWAGIDLDKGEESWEKSDDFLIQKGGNLVDTIGSCGYTGLVFSHGILKEYIMGSEEEVTFKANLEYYSAPTYYGMLSTFWNSTQS